MKTKFNKLALVLLGTVLIVSCGKANKANRLLGGSDATAAGTNIVSPDKALIGESVPIAVKAPAQMREVSWTIVNKAASTPIDSCSSLKGNAITCKFAEPGNFEIQVSARQINNAVMKDSKMIRILDPGTTTSQAPSILLQLKNADGSVISKVASLRGEEAGANNAARGATVTFDFSQTSDDATAADALKFEVDFDGKGYRQVGMVSSYSYTDIGVYPVKVRVTDADQNVTEKVFTMYVRCSDVESLPLSLNAAAISVVGSQDMYGEQTKNYFKYDATGAALGGGGGPYKFMWDFNGDGIWDTDWQSGLADNIYTVYLHNRSIGVKVWDTKCNFFKTASKDVDFALTFADGVPGNKQGPQQGLDQFIQGYVKGLNGNAERTSNLDFIATRSIKVKAEHDPHHVVCDFRRIGTDTSLTEGAAKANFYVKGSMRYKGVEHGMDLSLGNILDPTYISSAHVIAPGGLVTQIGSHQVRFFTDEAKDIVERRVFTNSKPCDIRLTIETMTSDAACASKPSDGFVALIDGTFSCPEMTDASGLKIEVAKGAFYCEVAKVDACVGGGGGGGGGIPPIPR